MLNYSLSRVDGLLLAPGQRMTYVPRIVWKAPAGQPQPPLSPLQEGDEGPAPPLAFALGTATMPLVYVTRPVRESAAAIVNTGALAPLLLTSPLLRCLNTTQVRHLCDIGKLLSFDPGQKIYRIHDEATHVYLVIEGSIETFGGRTCLREAGQLVGEFAFLSDARRSDTARAITPATVLAMPALLLRGLVGKCSSTLEELSPILAQELATAALARSGICQGLPLTVLDRLAKHCELRPFECGDVVGDSGAERQGVYLVVSGRLLSAETYGLSDIDTLDLREGVAFRLTIRTEPTLRAHARGWLLHLEREAIRELLSLSRRAREVFRDFT